MMDTDTVVSLPVVVAVPDRGGDDDVPYAIIAVAES